jgi:hypothetical protein
MSGSALAQYGGFGLAPDQTARYGSALVKLRRMNGDAGPQRAHAIEHDGEQLFRERIDSRMEAWLGQVIVEFVDKVVQLRSRTNRRSLRVLGHGGPP